MNIPSKPFRRKTLQDHWLEYISSVVEVSRFSYQKTSLGFENWQLSEFDFFLVLSEFEFPSFVKVSVLSQHNIYIVSHLSDHLDLASHLIFFEFVPPFFCVV